MAEGQAGKNMYVLWEASLRWYGPYEYETLKEALKIPLVAGELERWLDVATTARELLEAAYFCLHISLLACYSNFLELNLAIGRFAIFKNWHSCHQ